MTGRLPLAFILLTVMIDAMGIGLILPVMPDLIEEVGGTDLAGASLIAGWMYFAYGGMQFLFGPAVGIDETDARIPGEKSQAAITVRVPNVEMEQGLVLVRVPENGDFWRTIGVDIAHLDLARGVLSQPDIRHAGLGERRFERILNVAIEDEGAQARRGGILVKHRQPFGCAVGVGILVAQAEQRGVAAARLDSRQPRARGGQKTRQRRS